MMPASKSCNRIRCVFSVPLWILLILLCVFGSLEDIVAAEPPLSVSINRVDASAYPETRVVFSVVEGEGNTVAGLTTSNVYLYEGDCKISTTSLSSIAAGEETVAVILVIDRSGSMRGKPLTAAKSVAASFISRMSENDLVGVLPFATSAGPVTAVSAERGAVQNAIDEMRADGETAFYDAVMAAIKEISSVPADRKAVVALTDGRDTSSFSSLNDCIRSASEPRIQVYAVGLGRNANASALRTLSEKSDGTAFFAASADELGDIYRRIASSICNRYVLSYRSDHPSKDTAWCTVRLTVHYKGRSAVAQSQYSAPPVGATGKADVASAHSSVYLLLLIGLIGADVAFITVLLRRRRLAR